MIDNYTVVSGTYSEFIEEVNRHLENGWKLVGGVSVAYDGADQPNVFYAQALELIEVVKIGGENESNS